MKKPLAILLLLFSFVSAQETIAVIEFEGNGISQTEAKSLTNRLRNELVSLDEYTVIERGKMEEILKEQAFQQTGCTSDECAVEVGKLLSVQQIVVGSIDKVGSVFSVSARIVDVESAEILRTATYDHKGEIDDLLIVGMKEVGIELVQDMIDASTVADENLITLENIQPSNKTEESERIYKFNVNVDEFSVMDPHFENCDELEMDFNAYLNISEFRRELWFIKEGYNAYHYFPFHKEINSRGQQVWRDNPLTESTYNENIVLTPEKTKPYVEVVFVDNSSPISLLGYNTFQSDIFYPEELQKCGDGIALMRGFDNVQGEVRNFLDGTDGIVDKSWNRFYYYRKQYSGFDKCREAKFLRGMVIKDDTMDLIEDSLLRFGTSCFKYAPGTDDFSTIVELHFFAPQ